MSHTLSHHHPPRRPTATFGYYTSHDSTKTLPVQQWNLLGSDIDCSRHVAMKLFRNPNRPRTNLDLPVGGSHVVEVLFQLRTCDWEWYHSNKEVILKEILEVLEQSVLSRIFENDLESYHRKHNPQLFPPEVAGAKNTKSRGKVTTSKSKGRTGRAPVAQKSFCDTKEDKDVYFAFGELVQLAYRKQEIPSRQKGDKSIFLKPGGCREYIKLPHRLLVWVSRSDQQNRTNPDPENVDFYRPEMIPISALFKEPQQP